MKRQAENLENRSLMNSAPILGDVALAVAGGALEEPLKAVDHGCQWLTTDTAGESAKPPGESVLDASAAAEALGDERLLDSVTSIEHAVAEHLAGTSGTGSTVDAVWETADEDWSSP